MDEVLVGPAPRRPMPATLLPTLRGEHVMVGNGDGWHPGYIAWTEVYDTEAGPMVDVVAERDWWMHELNGAHPRKVRPWPAVAVYVP